MSFREKSTWVTFLLLLTSFGIYFGNAFFVLHGRHDHLGGQPTPNLVHLFVALIAGFVMLEIITHVVFAWRSPQEAKTPRDERERLIELKSMRPAFYVLLVGAFLAIGTLHLGTTTFHMAHSILLVVWVAELVRYGMQLYYFRRGV